MAQFRATIQGSRGEASRLGTKSTGITANVNGWDAGIRIEAKHSAHLGDVFEVYLTGGSNHRQPERLLGTFQKGSGDWYAFQRSANFGDLVTF